MTGPEDATRACKTCGTTKPLHDFPVQANCKQGRRASCKACAAERTKAWREADPVRAKESVRATREKNPERWLVLGRARSRRYAERNPEAKRESSPRYVEANKDKGRAWYLANADRVKARVKQWALDNPDKARINALASVNRRRARKLSATPSWANRDKIMAVYRKRERLQRLTGLKFHVDHEVPLANDKVCGLHTHHNLKVVPARVNLRKGSRFESGSVE